MGDAERGRIQTAEVRVDNVERGGCGVGNSLDSAHVDVVVDNRTTTRMQTNNRNGRASNHGTT